MIKMAKFRNLLGHIYMEIDNELIFEILQNNLDDFESYKSQIFSRFKSELIEPD